MITWYINIEPDDLYGEDKWMVVLRNGTDLYVPMRDVSREKAEGCIDSLAYAFQFGYEAGRSEITRHIWREGLTLEVKP